MSLRVGITRGDIPNYVDARSSAGASRRSGKFDRQLAEKEKEISALRARLGGGGEPTPTFFVVGNGRSGTTWLQSILDSHPEVLCSGEGWFFNRGYRRTENPEDVHPRLPMGSLYNAIAESEQIRLWVERSVWTVGDDVEEHLDNLTRLAAMHFLDRKLAQSGKKIVGDKTASTGPEALEEITRIMPDSKVVHAVRDGRDVAVSVMHFLWNNAKVDGSGAGIYDLSPDEIEKREAYRKDPEAALKNGGLFTEERLSEIAGGWAREVGSLTGRGKEALGGNYTEVRYEDLLERPEEEMKRVFAFLGADDSGKVVEKCVESQNFEKGSRRKKGQEDSSSVRFRKGVAGDWRNVFTERDKEIFKREAGDTLVRLGYEEDGGW